MADRPPRLARVSIIAVVAASALVGGGSTGSATGTQGATPRLDQTFLCTADLVGGIREIELRAHSGLREPGSRRWKQLPFAVVSTGTTTYAHLGNSLAFVTSGVPSATTTVGTDSQRLEVRAWGTIARGAGPCRPTRANVPLSTRGLRGGKVGPLEDTYECQGHRQVLVRVRAELRGPARLARREGLVRTSVPSKAARIMVRTRTGAPLAYAETVESGATRLFLAPGCTRD